MSLFLWFIIGIINCICLFNKNQCSGVFRCDNNETIISMKYYCDGISDCNDNSDEIDCPICDGINYGYKCQSKFINICIPDCQMCIENNVMCPLGDNLVEHICESVWNRSTNIDSNDNNSGYITTKKIDIDSNEIMNDEIIISNPLSLHHWFIKDNIILIIIMLILLCIGIFLLCIFVGYLFKRESHKNINHVYLDNYDDNTNFGSEITYSKNNNNNNEYNQIRNNTDDSEVRNNINVINMDVNSFNDINNGRKTVNGYQMAQHLGYNTAGNISSNINSINGIHNNNNNDNITNLPNIPNMDRDTRNSYDINILSGRTSKISNLSKPVQSRYSVYTTSTNTTSQQQSTIHGSSDSSQESTTSSTTASTISHTETTLRSRSSSESLSIESHSNEYPQPSSAHIKYTNGHHHTNGNSHNNISRNNISSHNNNNNRNTSYISSVHSNIEDNNHNIIDSNTKLNDDNNIDNINVPNNININGQAIYHRSNRSISSTTTTSLTLPTSSAFNEFHTDHDIELTAMTDDIKIQYPHNNNNNHHNHHKRHYKQPSSQSLAPISQISCTSPRIPASFYNDDIQNPFKHTRSHTMDSENMSYHTRMNRYNINNRNNSYYNSNSNNNNNNNNDTNELKRGITPPPINSNSNDNSNNNGYTFKKRRSLLGIDIDKIRNHLNNSHNTHNTYNTSSKRSTRLRNSTIGSSTKPPTFRSENINHHSDISKINININNNNNEPSMSSQVGLMEQFSNDL